MFMDQFAVLDFVTVYLLFFRSVNSAGVDAIIEDERLNFTQYDTDRDSNFLFFNQQRDALK